MPDRGETVEEEAKRRNRQRVQVGDQRVRPTLPQRPFEARPARQQLGEQQKPIAAKPRDHIADCADGARGSKRNLGIDVFARMSKYQDEIGGQGDRPDERVELRHRLHDHDVTVQPVHCQVDSAHELRVGRVEDGGEFVTHLITSAAGGSPIRRGNRQSGSPSKVGPSIASSVIVVLVLGGWRDRNVGARNAKPSRTPATAVLTPTIRLRLSASAPPLLPGFSAASVWITSSTTRPLRVAATDPARDDARGDAAGQPERVADRHNQLADAQVLGAPHRHRRRHGSVRLEDSEIRQHVTPDDVDAHRRAVGERGVGRLCGRDARGLVSR